MSDTDLQFEEFMKEPLSTDDSPGTNSSSNREANVKDRPTLSVHQKFWWMKERTPPEKNSTASTSHINSFIGVAGGNDGVRNSEEMDHVAMSPNAVNKVKLPDNTSPDITSSMAEFIEKEKLCKELSSSLSEVDSPRMDLDDVTDDDIGSIMEQLSQLAGSGDDSAADKSMEEILKEAEELVRETSHSFSGLSDSSDLLRAPITPSLVIRGRSANLLPASTANKKTERSSLITDYKGSNNSRLNSAPGAPKKPSSKIYGSGDEDREKQSNGRRAGSASATSGKIVNKKHGANTKFMTTFRKTENRYVKAGNNSKEEQNGSSKGGHISVTSGSKRIDSSPLGRKDRGDLLSSSKTSHISKTSRKTDSKSNYSHNSNNVLKKEKTVTFEENSSLPKSTDSSSKSHKESIVQASSQVPQEVLSATSKSSCENYIKSIELEREFPQPSTSSGAGLSLRRGPNTQVTQVVSVSPPLIQHGDMVGTPEAIFQLIDSEVRNEITVALQESKKESSQPSDSSSIDIEEEMEKIFGHDSGTGKLEVTPVETNSVSFPRKSLSVVLEESSVSDASLEVDEVKHAITMTEQLLNKESSDKSVQVSDTVVPMQIANLEKDLLEERNKLLQLKAERGLEEQEHRKQLDALKCKHEEEMFNLKKDVYVLNAKIADMEKQQEKPLDEKGGGDCRIEDNTVKEHHIVLLETELQQQEQLLLGYQRENLKLCQDMKQLKEELKAKEQSFATERHQLTSARQGCGEVEQLAERLKDKDEVIVKLELEVQALRDKNGSLEQTAEELKLAITNLQNEVEKHKCTVSKAVVSPTKTVSRNKELEHYRAELMKKELEVERVCKELHSAQADIAAARAEVNECQIQVGGLESKVSELKAMLTKERAQTRTHNLTIEEDKKKIQDLNRQVKEMERILKRNHPNSISALILTANSEGTDTMEAPTPRIKYLENRVQQLEQELSKSEAEAQTKLKDIQDKFQVMKVKYEEHTSDLELQLATAKHHAHMLRQAAEKNEARAAAENKVDEQPVREGKQSKKTPAPPMVIAVGAPSANALAVREDAHLLATIRGLKLELAAKDKELVKIRKELDESSKTNRRLQREREHQLGNINAPSRPPAVKGTAKEEQLSETSQRSSSKIYDPTRFEPSPPEQQEGVIRLEQENQKLRQELLRLEEEYRGLQIKRLQDLNLLQEQHETEMDQLIADHMSRHSNSRIADLQGQLSTQQMVIGHLKDQLKQLDEYREDLAILKAERDHLEKSNIDLSKKLNDLRSIQTPEMLQYETLQEKLNELELRHETREQKLQTMVRDLLRRNAAHLVLNGEDSTAATMREKLLDKNRQLCMYRAEIDRILDTLREFNRHKTTGSTIHLAPD